MSLIKHKLAAATAVAAAFSLVATPAAAIELPRPADAPQVRDAGALDVENRRHRGHWDDDDDIDGDDILAGVLILGGIAAIAGIANSGRNRQEAPPEPFPEEADYQAPPRNDRYVSGGMTDAVDACVAEAEAGHGPVGSVDRASRSGEGWYVAGELDSGTSFACWVDGSGRVTDLEAGGYGASYETPAPDEAGYSTVHKQAIEGDPDADARYALAEAAE